jgi:hypothetical protein
VTARDVPLVLRALTAKSANPPMQNVPLASLASFPRQAALVPHRAPQGRLVRSLSSKRPTVKDVASNVNLLSWTRQRVRQAAVVSLVQSDLKSESGRSLLGAQCNGTGLKSTPLYFSENTLRCVPCQPGTFGVGYSVGEENIAGTCLPCPAGKTSLEGSIGEDSCVLAPTHNMGRRAALARVGACDRGLTACLLTEETWDW